MDGYLFIHQNIKQNTKNRIKNRNQKCHTVAAREIIDEIENIH